MTITQCCLTPSGHFCRPPVCGLSWRCAWGYLHLSAPLLSTSSVLSYPPFGSYINISFHLLNLSTTFQPLLSTYQPFPSPTSSMYCRGRPAPSAIHHPVILCSCHTANINFLWNASCNTAFFPLGSSVALLPLVTGWGKINHSLHDASDDWDEASEGYWER